VVGPAQSLSGAANALAGRWRFAQEPAGVPPGCTVKCRPIMDGTEGDFEAALPLHEFQPGLDVVILVDTPGRDLMVVKAKVEDSIDAASVMGGAAGDGDANLSGSASDSLQPGRCLRLLAASQLAGTGFDSWSAASLQTHSILLRVDTVEVAPFPSWHLDAPQQRSGDDSTKPFSRSTSVPAAHSVSAGMTAGGTHFRYPPVNVPPLPGGFLTDGRAFYSRFTARIHDPPVGRTSDGRPYFPHAPYGGDRLDLMPAGISLLGANFFLPEHATLPSPDGFTPAGVPYYDPHKFSYLHLLSQGRLLIPDDSEEAFMYVC
jgi:hypothetical protein